MRVMRHLNPLLITVAATGILLSSSATAATCTFGPGTAGESSLQAVMNGLFGSGAPVATSDCVAEGNDAVWKTMGVGAATLIVEIAGYANLNTFGIYDLANTGNLLQVYAGANDPFDRRTITFTQDGGVYDVTIARPNGSVVQTGTFSSTLFGFYLGTPQYSGQTYYSNTLLNPDGVDHLYAYQGNGAIFRNNSSVPSYLRGDTFSEQMYLLAWEDLYGGGDGDYQDMVLLTDFIVPVPVPPALLLLGSALAGLGLLRSGRRVSPRSVRLAA